ncbi:MAG: phosphoserine phosphatase SerB [Spirochaetia bacterium]|nr:phosphoserine phosphatase SerB [Spirochaetia bacterium]
MEAVRVTHSCEVCDAVKSENVLLHITGQDHPGILARLTRILQQWRISFIDVQQTTSLGQLSLSLLVNIPEHIGLNVLKEISYESRNMKLSLDYFILPDKPDPARDSGKSFALTVLSPRITMSAFGSIAQTLGDHGINIERMNRLAQGNLEAIEFILSVDNTYSDFGKLKRLLFKVAFENNFDLAVQPENLYRRSKRLIVMDMDSTLIQQEVIDELADEAGKKEEVSLITREAMQGKLDFSESLKKRVSLLKGLPESVLVNVLARIQLTPGADILISILKKMGFKIAVISGGFTYFTDHFKEKLGLDYSFANRLEIIDGILTGNVVGEIIDRAGKAAILKKLALEEKILIDQTVAIGDGANDLDMLEAAGLGVAFNAKPTVRDKAGAFISQPSLDSVLYLLGVSQKELTQMQGK